MMTKPKPSSSTIRRLLATVTDRTEELRVIRSRKYLTDAEMERES